MELPSSSEELPPNLAVLPRISTAEHRSNVLFPNSVTYSTLMQSCHNSLDHGPMLARQRYDDVSHISIYVKWKTSGLARGRKKLNKR